MKNTEKKPVTPPYATYKSFLNLVNKFHLDESIPPEISYSVLSGSNSGKATMAATLRYLDLIDDDKCPTDEFKQLVDDQDSYSINLEKILKKHYPYLFDETINLENTTTEMVMKKFREQGASGSTISKCMSFFLAAAKDSGILVHDRIKPPSPAPRRTKPKKNNQNTTQTTQPANGDDGNYGQEIPEGMEQITIPLRGMEDGIIFFPEELDENDAKRAINMTKFILMQYYGLTDE